MMSASSKSTDILHDANLRLCRIQMWDEYDGFGFHLKSSSKPPYIIYSVEPCSPAAAGGLKIQDVILAIDNQNVSSISYDQVIDAIKDAHARDNNGLIELLVVKQHFYRSLVKKKITLDVNSANVMITPQRMPADYRNYLRYQPRSCGISFKKPEKRFGFDVTYGENDVGVFIQKIHPNTPASRSILREHDRIIEINKKSVETKGEKSIYRKLDSAKLQGYVQLYVMDDETYRYYQSNGISLASKKHGKNRLRNTHDINNQDYLCSGLRRLSNASDEELLRSKFHPSVPNGVIHVRKSCYLTSRTNRNLRPSINLCKGDLVAQQTDVIVVCSSSQHLFDSICQAGGTSLSDAYNVAVKTNPRESITAVPVSEKLRSKQIYFLPWKADSNTNILCKSIEKFVSDAIEKAAQENYRSIAFPAIGCGQFGCSVNLVAQIMIGEADRQLLKHNVSVLFVIQPDKADIYDEFEKHIRLLQSQQSAGGVEAISTTVGKGTIVVEQGDITMQKVDVIISSSSSDFLRKAIIKAAGNEVETAYINEYEKNPNAILIATSPGALYCKRIFFLKWEPATDEKTLRQSLLDLMSTVIQNMSSHSFTSIAFPAIGCGQHGCSLDIVVKTMVTEMKAQLIDRDVPWRVKFVIQSDQPNIYDEFCKQVLTAPDDPMEPQLIQFPPTWEKSKGDKIRFVLSTISDEYKSLVFDFDKAMKGKYTQIIRIERIQNERCYVQYLAHSKDFRKRLNMDTEKHLYHGCPEQASNSIIHGHFNRRFAGKNGTAYGVGAYFSSDAAYSHKFATQNTNGERCMFVVRVLVGKTTEGDESMKTPPVGFDSTTGRDHIFVTYHDAQALAEYLITYK